MDALKDHFRPEFLNRLDDIIVFDTLSKEAIAEIVKIQVDVVRERLLQKEIKLELSEAVFTHLAEEGYSPQYGARPLKRLIQNKILTPVASLIVSNGITKGGTILVDVKEPSKTSGQVDSTISPQAEYFISVKKSRRTPLLSDTFVGNMVAR